MRRTNIIGRPWQTLICGLALDVARGDPERVEGSTMSVFSVTRPSRSTRRASAIAGQLRVVRDQHDRRPSGGVDRSQQLHDVPAVRAVEVAGRLVGEHDRRVVRQRAGERHALLLAAGQLRRIVVGAPGQSDFFEQPLGARADVRCAGNLHRHGDVLVGGERRNQMEELEDEADLLPAQLRQRVLVESGDVHVVDQHGAGRRRVQAGDQSEERRLAAARRSDDRHELAVRDLQRQRVKNGQRLAAAGHGFGNVSQLDHDPGRPNRLAMGSSAVQTLSATMRAPVAVG